MTHDPKRRRGEEGQALILMMLAMTVVFVIGVIVVDMSLWLTERRGAQKDADASTMAGAHELLLQDFINPAANNPAAVQAAAEAAVYKWADYNGLAAADVHNLAIGDTDCLGPSPVIDTVRLDAEHHTRELFTSIFNGLVVPEIGAPSKACLGSIITAEGLLPVGIQISGVDSDCWDDVDGDGQEDPLFGQSCILTFGAGQQVSGEAGNLRLFNDGSLNCSDNSTGGKNTYEEEVAAGGANTQCHVYKYFDDPSKNCDDDPAGCVFPLTGVGSTPEMKAFEDLMGSEGECDGAFSPPTGPDVPGVDDFLEVVEAINGDTTPSPDTLFAKRDCDSPRLVSLVIVKQFGGQGNPPMPIEAFAGFYIEGCTNEDGSQFSQKCRKTDFQGQIGQFRLKGYFVDILVTSGDVGGISKWSPKQVVLVE